MNGAESLVRTLVANVVDGAHATMLGEFAAALPNASSRGVPYLVALVV